MSEQKAISPILTILILLIGAISAAIGIGYVFFSIYASQPGFYAEVVDPNVAQGGAIVRFIYFDKNDSSWGYCNQPPRLLRGAYQIQNQTFFYFHPTIQLGNIIGRDVSATQLMYERGAICP